MIRYAFRWITFNLNKIAKHGLKAGEVEFVVNNARKPYPKPIGNGKWHVIGPTRSGKMIQAIYLVDDDETIFVIHAR